VLRLGWKAGIADGYDCLVSSAFFAVTSLFEDGKLLSALAAAFSFTVFLYLNLDDILCLDFIGAPSSSGGAPWEKIADPLKF